MDFHKFKHETAFTDGTTEAIKCGEIFIDENDLFNFLCTLCETQFEETEKLLVHIRSDHSRKRNQSDVVESRHENNIENMKYEPIIKISTDVEENLFENRSNDFEKINGGNELNSKFESSKSDDTEEFINNPTIFNSLIDDQSNENTKCDICGKKFTTESYLKIHRRNVKCEKKLKRPFICDICGKQFPTRRSLKRHKLFTQRGHQPEQKIEDIQSLENDPLKCEYCSRRFPDTSQRIDHQRIHTGEKPFQCQICGKQFRTRAVCTTHEKTHSSERRYKCELCNMAFKNKSTLYSHNQRHGERKFPCSHCDKSFFLKSERIEHERTHTGEKPYKCDFCEKCFAAYSGFARHSRSHLNIRPHKCQYCDRSFFTKTLLNNHVVIHTGERPFVCTVCNATFRLRKALKSHEKIHSDIRAYVCKICGKGYKQRTVLNSHMKSHQKVLMKSPE